MILPSGLALRAGIGLFGKDKDGFRKPRWPHTGLLNLVGKVALWAAVNGHTFGMTLLATAGHGGDAIWAP